MCQVLLYTREDAWQWTFSLFIVFEQIIGNWILWFAPKYRITFNVHLQSEMASFAGGYIFRHVLEYNVVNQFADKITFV